MAVQDNRGGIQLNVVQPVASGASSRGSLHNLTGSPKNEQSSCGNDYFPKARKPYTITKQRERWTEEEHKKFLEALKLYGRAWRRIEEHIGTKTAVQTRSHAQKFFSKVVRESGDNSTSPTEPIEIPPPRPKRKPMRPYPRKMTHPLTKEPLSLEKPIRSSSPNSYLTEPENQSPTSVLSAVAPDICDSNTPNQSLSPVSPACGFHPVELMLSEPLSSPEYSGSPTADLQTVCSAPSQRLLKENDSSEEGLAKEKSTRCLKLFGRTVLVTECHQPSSQTGENSILLASDTCEKKPTEMLLWDLTQSGKKESTWANLPHVNHGVFYYVPIQKEDGNQVERGSCALLPWGTFPGGVSFPFVPFQKQEHHLDSKCEETPYKGIQKEGSLTGSNSGSINGGENMDNETQSPQFPLEKKELSPALELRYSGRSTLSNGKTSPEKSMRGFVPYKKSKTQRDSYSSTVIGEEREEQKIHLFL